MERWTRLMVRHRWLVAAAWLVVLLAGGYLPEHSPLTHGFDVTFYVLSALAIVGALIAVIFIEPQRRRPKVDGPSEAALLAAVFGVYAVRGFDNLAWAKMFPNANDSSGGSGCGGGGCGGGCGGCGS